MFTVIVTLALAGAVQGDREQLEFFEKRIRPLLVERCHRCHSAQAKQPKGGLRLDTRAALLRGGESGAAILPGNPARSLLLAAVRHQVDGLEMPPDGKLTERQIADLTRWVEMGAPWPRAERGTRAARQGDSRAPEARAHWAFRPLVERAPRPARSDWPRSPVDEYILEKLDEAGLAPAAPADKRTLLRRIHLDLVGLPPTPEDVRAFLSDASPDAYEKVVDRLLASPRYGERWGRHWLDLVRFAETAGNEFDYEIPFAWRYRDYVIRALNEDVPYERFVVEHIAGDLLNDPRRHAIERFNESTIATGFFWLGQAMQSPIDVLAAEYETIENQIDVMTKTFLGLTVACARCHDHKFDPVSMEDYYALVGYLQSSRRQFAFIDPSGETRELIERIETRDASERAALVEEVAGRLAAALERVADLLAGALPPAVIGAGSGVALEPPVPQAALSSYLEEEAAKDLLDPLHPWAVLASAATPAAFRERRAQLLRRYREASGPESSTADVTVCEEFDGTSYGDWRTVGAAFGAAPTEGVSLVIGDSEARPIHRLVAPGVAHSGRVAGRLRGGLRSPTFRIERKFIDYRAWRSKSEPAVEKIDPGDLKKGQIHLVLDGHHLIRQPIYEGLSIDVAVDTPPRWYRQDVSKWIGHRAYIEITDEDNGFIAVDRVLFSDASQPSAPPGRLLLDVLEDDRVVSRESLAQRYEELLTHAIDLWRRGSLASSPLVAEHVSVINWLLAHGARLLEPAARQGPRAPAARAAAYVAARRSLSERIAVPRRALSMLDGTGEDARVLARGNHERPTRPAPRRFLAALGKGGRPESSRASGRLELARRMVDPSSPLLARVLVNRLWKSHFGRGIVPTPDDFGIMGQPPSHPELLDFLAGRFVESGWSVKHMHRLLVTSSTYRMSSAAHDAAAERLDPGNRLLHRMPLRRLEGEIIRDQLLALSGRLDRRMEGPGVAPHLTSFMEGRGRPKDSGPLDGDGRRSIYINVRRNFLSPLFLVFDYPLPESTVGRRSVSNVPAQALAMLNNPLVVEQSRLWADRLLRECAGDRAARVRWLYEAAFVRPPTSAEAAAAEDFLERAAGATDGVDPHVWAELAHVLMNLREFIFVR